MKATEALWNAIAFILVIGFLLAIPELSCGSPDLLDRFYCKKLGHNCELFQQDNNPPKIFRRP